MTAGYLAGGQRAFKTSSSGSTYYLYDGQKPVCEIDGTGAITAVNTWGANGLVSRDTSSGSAYYTFDPQGSVCQKLDGTGSPTFSTMFDAYGSPASTNSDPYNAPGAQFGNYRDAETGLVWMGHRYYDPTSGRFLTRDPAEEGTGANEYAYTDNNPVTRYDALGLGWNSNSDIAPDGENRNTWQYAFKADGAGFVYAITDGNYDGGIYRCDPNWELIKALMGYAWTMTNVALGDEMALSEGSPEIGECGIAGGGCFTAGTPVQMSDGSTKPVEQVKTGDVVESRNEKSGKTEPEKVTATIKHYNVPTITLTFSNGDQVVTTGVHPFYVQGRGFVPASDLAIGNAIVTRAGPAVTITGIEQTAPETVYNITVDGDHTYFVGSKDGGVWVHNTNPLLVLHPL